jgi:hypothetical protein
MFELNANTELENKNELTLAKAREILNDETISDEKLDKIIDSVNIFCRISYELFSSEQEKTEQVGQIVQIEQTEFLRQAA